MCKTIEAYALEIAEERAIDTAIVTCIDFGKTFDETIDYVSSKFDTVSKDYLISRFAKFTTHTSSRKNR